MLTKMQKASHPKSFLSIEIVFLRIMWKLASVRDEMRREYGAKFNTGDAIRLNLFAFYHKNKAKGRRSNKLAVSFL